MSEHINSRKPLNIVMKVLLALVGRTYDSEPILVLDIDGQKYLLNAPENIHRLCRANKMKVTAFRHIFTTSIASGGLVIPSNFWQSENIEITGPPEIEELLGDNDFRMVSPGYVGFTRNYRDENISVDTIQLDRTVAMDIKCKDRPGRFLPQVALRLGVPKGPLFQQLRQGNDVCLEDGTIVRAEDCKGDPIPGDRILVINCESQGDIDAMLGDLSRYSVIVHLTEAKLMNTESYKNKLPDTAKHLCFARSGKVTRKQHDERYTRIRSSCREFLSDIWRDDDHESIPESFINLDTGDSFVIDTMTINRSVEAPTPKTRCSLPVFDTFAVTVLGTSAGFPSHERNLPGYLVHTKDGYILLDAGDGILHQLYRKYGPENGDSVLMRLKCIWISHGHCDHVAGLLSILARRRELTDEKIPLFGDTFTLNYVRLLERQHRKEFLVNMYHLPSVPVFEMNNLTIQNVSVSHCPEAFGCCMTIDKKWKLAYSGDKRRDDAFVQSIGQVDMLIHESTFIDYVLEDEERRHSTVKEAVEVSREVGSKLTILTHLSGRYNQFIETDDPRVFMSFDLLDISFDNLSCVPEIVRGCRLSYA